MCLPWVDERIDRREQRENRQPRTPGRRPAPDPGPGRVDPGRPARRRQGAERLLRGLRGEPEQEGLPGHGRRRVRRHPRSRSTGPRSRRPGRGPTTGIPPIRASINAAKRGMRPALVVYGTPNFVHKSTRKGLYGPKSKARPEGLAEVLGGARAALQPERRLLRRGARDRQPAGQELDRLERAELEEQLGAEARSPCLRKAREGVRRGDLEGRPEGADRARRHVRVPARLEVDEGDQVPEEALQGQGHRQALRRGQLASLRIGRRRRQAARSTTCARSPGGPAIATPASSSASSDGPRRDRRAASRSSASRVRRSGSATA